MLNSPEFTYKNGLFREKILVNVLHWPLTFETRQIFTNYKTSFARIGIDYKEMGPNQISIISVPSFLIHHFNRKVYLCDQCPIQFLKINLVRIFTNYL